MYTYLMLSHLSSMIFFRNFHRYLVFLHLKVISKAWRSISNIAFYVLPFCVYNHLFFCKRKMIASYNYCYLCTKIILEDRAVFNAVCDRLIFDCGLFEDIFTDLFLLDLFYLQVHQCWHDISFDRFYGSFYRNLLLARFFCLKKYVEVVGRVFYKKVQEDIFCCLANIFL